MQKPKNLKGAKEKGVYRAKDGYGNFIDPAFAIFPVIKRDANGLFSLIGTGFFISDNGIFLTADHVLMDVIDDETGEQTHALFLVQYNINNSFIMRPIMRCVTHSVADIAVGVAAPMKNKKDEELKNKFLTLSSKLGEEGSRICTYAYPKTVITKSVEQELWFYADFYEGEIQENFPNGRDSSLMPGACCQTSMYIHGGASGGPVFDEKGAVCAVNSTGFDNDPLSFITPVHTIENLLLEGVKIPTNKTGKVRISELIDNNFIIYR